MSSMPVSILSRICSRHTHKKSKLAIDTNLLSKSGHPIQMSWGDDQMSVCTLIFLFTNLNSHVGSASELRPHLDLL